MWHALQELVVSGRRTINGIFGMPSDIAVFYISMQNSKSPVCSKPPTPSKTIYVGRAVSSDNRHTSAYWCPSLMASWTSTIDVLKSNFQGSLLPFTSRDTSLRGPPGGLQSTSLLIVHYVEATSCEAAPHLRPCCRWVRV